MGLFVKAHGMALSLHPVLEFIASAGSFFSYYSLDVASRPNLHLSVSLPRYPESSNVCSQTQPSQRQTPSCRVVTQNTMQTSSAYP